MPMSGDSTHIVRSLYPDISHACLWQLNRYVNLLREYNCRINLISRADTDQIWEHHILPSLIIDKIVEFRAGQQVMDLGSGGGLPGIPLKIIHPAIKMLLVDSSRKKIAFLRRVIYDLRLTSTGVVRARLPQEAERNQLTNRFHCMLARGVSDFKALCEIAVRVLLPEGYLLAWKGEKDVDELQEISEKNSLIFKIHAISDKIPPVSDKFAALRIVQVWFPGSQKLAIEEEE